MSDTDEVRRGIDRAHEAAGRIMLTKNGLWVSDGLSDRVIGATFGDLVGAADRLFGMTFWGREPDRIGAEANLRLIAMAVDRAYESFEASEKPCPHCGKT